MINQVLVARYIMALNILIVDDSALTRKAIRRVIDMVGVHVEQVLEAENGKEALEMLDTESVDLVLADLNMPVMDGMEMIYHMRVRSPFPWLLSRPSRAQRELNGSWPTAQRTTCISLSNRSRSERS